MEPSTAKVWTPAETRAELGAILVESLGVDRAAVRDEAALIGDLGAESIDFLDISFKAQQVFGVDLPTRLIQDQILDWRNLNVLAAVLGERHRLPVTGEELRTVSPSTLPAIFKYLREQHGLTVDGGAELGLAEALARHLLAQMGELGLDMSGIDTALMARLLYDNVHSPKVMEEVLQRFTVGALARYVLGRLAAASRLASGA